MSREMNSSACWWCFFAVHSAGWRWKEDITVFQNWKRCHPSGCFVAGLCISLDLSFGQLNSILLFITVVYFTVSALGKGWKERDGNKRIVRRWTQSTQESFRQFLLPIPRIYIFLNCKHTWEKDQPCMDWESMLQNITAVDRKGLATKFLLVTFSHKISKSTVFKKNTRAMHFLNSICQTLQWICYPEAIKSLPCF